MQQYAAFVRERDRAKMTKEQAMDEERRINMMIDWHDFVGTLINNNSLKALRDCAPSARV